MAHEVKIQEIINGVQITETIDGNIVVKLISYQSKPFLRTTNESAEETYQVLDIVGEIYNTPALATDFRIIDANDNVFIPANGVELIEYSLKVRAFRPDADVNEVLAVGPITTTSNSVTLGLHASGTNAVRIDGLTYEKYYPDLFNFTPVTTGEKILIIHALPDAQVFHLVQGAESTEAVEPSYSGLFVARLLVTTEGIDIIEATSGFREKAVDNFAIYSFAAGDRVIGFGANMRLKVQSSGAVRIGGFVNEEDKLYNGCPISVRNDTPFPMEFYNAVDASPEFIAINSADLPFSIKPGETANFAYRGGGIAEIIKTGTTGDLTLEQARQNGNILEGDVEIRIPNDTVGGFLGVRDDVPALISGDNKHSVNVNGFTREYPDNSTLILSVGYSDSGIDILAEGTTAEEIKGIVGSQEFNKQGDRNAFAQLSDVYDIANGKVDKPTTTSDFTAYPYIVGMNDAGNSARFVAGNFDIISALHDSNLRYALPNFNSSANYSTLRNSAAIAQTGAVPGNDNVSQSVDYKSNGSTLGNQWGPTMNIQLLYGRDFSFVRKFAILTTVTTQRMFIGLSTLFGSAKPINQALETLVDVVGVCMIENSNKIWFIYNNNTGSAILHDSGFTNDINCTYKLILYQDSAMLKMKLVRENRFTYSTDIVEHTLSEFPINSIFPGLWCVDSAGTAITTIRDYGFTSTHKGYRNL